MARLPDASALGASPTPTPQRGIQTYRGGIVEGVAVEAGLDLMRTGQRVMHTAEHVQNKVDRLEYSRAKSAFLRAKVEADNAFAEDQDYATFETRYRERLRKGLDESLKRISNGSLREAFAEEAGLDFERGALGIREFARGKEKDANRAFLNEEITANLQTALQADRATANGILSATNDAIMASKEKGYLTAQEAQQLSRNFASNYAVSRIGMLPVTEQLKVLKDGMTSKEGALPVFAKRGTEVDFIPPDKRVELIRGLEAKAKPILAKQIADEITGPAGASFDLAGWLKKADAIADPEMKAAVQSQLRATMNLNQELRSERIRGTRQAVTAKVMQDKSFDNLTPGEMAFLQNEVPETYRSLESYVEKRGKVPENTALYNRMNTMAVEDPVAFRNFDMDTLIGQMPDERVRHFSDMKTRLNQNDAKEAAKRETAERAFNMSKVALKAAGINVNPKPGTDGAERLDAFKSALADRVYAFQEEKQGKATEKEIAGLVDGLLMEGSVRRDWMPDASRRAFEVTPEEREKFYVPFDQIPANKKTEIVNRLQKKGATVTNELVESIYGDMLMAGQK
jgi:hypothetical protein